MNMSKNPVVPEGLSAGQMDLFGDGGAVQPGRQLLRPAAVPEESALTEAATKLLEISPNAYEGFVLGWMSELPIGRELLQFAGKVISAGSRKTADARAAAEQAAVDRGDPAVSTVLEAAYKVNREIDRLRGLLRFSPDSEGVYIARCAPDHFVLPELADHFLRRFGETPWVIIDERRGLALVRRRDMAPELVDASALPTAPAEGAAWEELWRTYHRSINNEGRKNPGLQRQFMPVRYWKYLTELQQ
jgi:hypothetical protein